MDQLSCPNCEYDKGNRGKPEVRGDHILCLACGNGWKDISADARPLVQDTSRDKIVSELRARLRREASPTFGTAQSAHASRPRTTTVDIQSPPPTHFKPVIAAFFVLSLLAIAGLLSYHFIHPAEQKLASKTVSLSDIIVKERLGREGKKVITVRGLVQNGTDEHQPLRPISIILRRKDGGEIIRWRHVSHRPVLKAGGKSRFASSIQYDTPIIAYAEAIFE